MTAEIVATQNRTVAGADDDGRPATFAGDHVALGNHDLEKQDEHGQSRGPTPRARAALPNIERSPFHKDRTYDPGRIFPLCLDDAMDEPLIMRAGDKAAHRYMPAPPAAVTIPGIGADAAEGCST